MKNLNHFLLFLLIIAADCPSGCHAQGLSKLQGYDISSPSSNLILPAILNEISGIVVVDSSTLACLQDEIGIIFFLDIRTARIINKVSFAGKGDFEALSLAGKKLYALRSDGILYEISGFNASIPGVKIIETGIPARNNEGLCYDSRSGRLLISCKDSYIDDELKNKHLVYAFDIKSGKLVADPVIVFDVKQIRKYVKEYGIKFQGIDEDETDKLGFKPSDIGINPLTGKLFLLSASDNALIVSDIKGRIESVQPLRKELFRQAEGITFNSRGDLFISNESAGKAPNVLRFNYRKSSSTATIH